MLTRSMAHPCTLEKVSLSSRHMESRLTPLVECGPDFSRFSPSQPSRFAFCSNRMCSCGSSVPGEHTKSWNFLTQFNLSDKGFGWLC